MIKRAFRKERSFLFTHREEILKGSDGVKLEKGMNDLPTVNPTLAEEWNYEKNGTLTSDMVTAGSHKKVWWKCDKGHEWEADISSRKRGRGCPFCAGRRKIRE